MSAAIDRRYTLSTSKVVASPVHDAPVLPAATERFLADASEALAERLDLESVLRVAVQLPVPHLADICVLDVRVGSESTRRIVTQHPDPSVDHAQRLFTDQHLPPPPAPRSPVTAVLAHGDTLVHTVFARDDHADAQARSLAAIVVGVLDASDDTAAVLSFLAHASDRQFGPLDRLAAEAFARRLSRAIRNARRMQDHHDHRMRAEAQLEVLRHTADVLTQCTEELRRELDRVRQEHRAVDEMQRPDESTPR